MLKFEITDDIKLFLRRGIFNNLDASTSLLLTKVQKSIENYPYQKILLNYRAYLKIKSLTKKENYS